VDEAGWRPHTSLYEMIHLYYACTNQSSIQLHKRYCDSVKDLFKFQADAEHD